MKIHTDSMDSTILTDQSRPTAHEVDRKIISSLLFHGQLYVKHQTKIMNMTLIQRMIFFRRRYVRDLLRRI
jgi:hypothetical protein